MATWLDTIYQRRMRRSEGTRELYLQELAEDYGVPLPMVKQLADLLGPDEDFDGLVSEVTELSNRYL